MRFTIFLLLSSTCFSQFAFKGFVKNMDGEPIEGVVISVSRSEKSFETESIVVSNDLGEFVLELENESNYTLKTKHLSYEDKTIELNSNSKTPLIILLKPNTQSLEEIVIVHERPKISIKQDTISFNLTKYIDPNDRKLRDLVEKLPGLTVQEDGTIYFKGEKITKLLVENEEFFGGGTKLGLDNIPADALEKLEIIANYSKSKLLKDNRRNDEQVINLVLKKNRKSIVFGNADAATDFDKFYKLHTSLFQFKKKQQNNIVLDGNNIAEQSIGDNESEAFANIDSELFNLIEIPINYNIDDDEFSKINSKFAGVNFKRIREKSTWDFLSYYNQLNDTKELIENQEYFNNGSFESKMQLEKKDLSSFYFRTTNYLQRLKKERLFAFAISTNNIKSAENIKSNSNFGNRNFINNNIDNNFYLTTVFEETRQLKEKANIVYGAKIDLQKSNTDFSLIGNHSFLDEFIPWMDQSDFKFVDVFENTMLNAEIGVVYLNSFDKYNTLSISPRFHYTISNLEDKQNQLLDSGVQNDFGSLFESAADYEKTQMGVKFNYRYRKNSWDILFGATLLMFDLNLENTLNNTGFSKIVINPFANLMYVIDGKKQLSIAYFKRLELPSIEQLNPYFKIKDYTSIIIGNPNLEEESSHNISMGYFDFNIPRSYSFTSSGSLEIKEKSFAPLYTFNDINSTATYFIQHDAGYEFSLRNSFFYLLKQSSLGVNLSLNHTDQDVQLNTIQNSETTKINVNPKFETNFKNSPNISVSPFWIYNSQKLGHYNDEYISSGFKSKLDYDFTNQIYIKTAYSFFQIDGNKTFDSTDFELRYTNKIKSMDMAIIGVNIFSSNIKNNVFQTTVFRSENITKTLGRRILLKFSYNF